ncbi:uncharacterized protein METZ01_LOCUS87511 [marine metagenome]|uniref:Uncharacterized protein n=1 Tax=marine metagenome TaxID=408172 RepID=A0A381V4R1_9ZZZZ
MLYKVTGATVEADTCASPQTVFSFGWAANNGDRERING